MATAAKWPAALLALVDVGGEMAGIVTAVLSGSHNAAVTTITLTAAVPASWPTAGWVTIDSEIIQYGGKSGSTLTSCTRGSQTAMGGGAAAIHNDQAVVGLYLTPQQWNQIVAEIIAMQLLMPSANTHSLHFEPFGSTPGAATIVNVGGGTTTFFPAGRGLQLNTSATNPSSTSMRVNSASNLATDTVGLISKVRRIEFQVVMSNTYANSNSYLYFTDEATDVAPSGTSRHFGVKNLLGVVTFTTADGTTEQTTDISAFVAVAAMSYVVITFDGTTAKCYVNGTLRATHATNVPAAGGAPVLRAFINNNTSANDRTMQLYVADALILNS